MYSFKDLGGYIGLHFNCLYQKYATHNIYIFNYFMFLQSKERGNMTVALLLEKFIASFTEPKVEWLSGHKWYLKVNDRKLFTLVGRTPYMNMIHIFVSFNAIKHLQQSRA